MGGRMKEAAHLLNNIRRAGEKSLESAVKEGTKTLNALASDGPPKIVQDTLEKTVNALPPEPQRVIKENMSKTLSSLPRSAGFREAVSKTILNTGKEAAKIIPAKESAQLASYAFETSQRASMIGVGLQQWSSLLQQGVLPGSGGRIVDPVDPPPTSSGAASTAEDDLLVRNLDIENFEIPGMPPLPPLPDLESVKLSTETNLMNAASEAALRESEILKADIPSADDFNAAIQNTIGQESSVLEDGAGSLPDPNTVSATVQNIAAAELKRQQEEKADTAADSTSQPSTSAYDEKEHGVPKAAAERKSEPSQTVDDTAILKPEAKERRVPVSRIGRVVTFGAGAIAEVGRRSLGLNKKSKLDGGAMMDAVSNNSPFLTEANAERIVETLCRVRGAALKIGQMLSLQDENVVNPQIQAIFERVRHSADFMPIKQLTKVLRKELGEDWRDRFAEFDERPFAAASIGQVHRAILRDGTKVAIKVQYPGVAESMESDINNLMTIMNVANIFPEGMYLDKFIAVAKHELALECNYEREAEASKKMKKLVADNPNYYVPSVVDELTTNRVLTTEFIDGILLDEARYLDQDTRNQIISNVLNLCLQEVFEFGFMQTDPNWANFFYSNAEQSKTGQPCIVLLDFGAARHYRRAFVDDYFRIISGAADQNKAEVLKWSRKIGFLTGYETKIMEDAHCKAVMILGEAFHRAEPFDFAKNDMTVRIADLGKTMLEHRLTPPPEETYSLHRKLSGAFLLAARLRANISCKPLFDVIRNRYVFGLDDKPEDLEWLEKQFKPTK